MADLSTPDEFRLILDFAIGIADRGLPLAVVRVAPEGDDDLAAGPGLERLRAAMAYLTRKTDRITMPRPGRFDVLLVDCNRQGALIFARRALEGLAGWEEVAGVRMGCGIACFAPNLSSTDALLAAADDACGRALLHDARIEIHGG